MPAPVTALVEPRAAPAHAAERGWIGSRPFDLAFFFGGVLLAGAAGGAALIAPALVVPIWWLFLLLFDGPHHYALDRAIWRPSTDGTLRRELGLEGAA